LSGPITHNAANLNFAPESSYYAMSSAAALAVRGRGGTAVERILDRNGVTSCA